MQTRKLSLLESLVNVGIGYIVAVVSQVAIFHLVGVHVPLRDNLLIGAWFTVISIPRSYLIRRWFNWWFNCR